MRFALLIYGVLNAILYASLLPLWDGFDEPFHYGYVQMLARERSIPRLKQTVLSEEIWQSLSLAPASGRVKRNLPQVMTFDEYFSQSPAARAKLRTSLANLPPSLAGVPSQMQNYEAQHPPLAYVPLAFTDLLLKGCPLLLRVWLLRLICAIGAVLAAGFVTFRLSAHLGVPSAYAHAALFVVFSSQMFYGATAHVANDWLAIPLFAAVISGSIDLYKAPSIRSAFGAALVLAAGLLTKSYFLALLPLICGVFLALAVRRKLKRPVALVFGMVLIVAAGPWYARNLVLYGNLSGMQETAGGVPVVGVLSAAFELPWLRALIATARGGLWTGNNSFNAFSASTSYVMLALIALGLLIYGSRWGRWTAAERITFGACLCYVAALSYATILIFLNTPGESVAAPAWHVQALLIPGWILLFLGLSRSGRPGRAIAIAIVFTWTYFIISTYFAKLIPFYAGYPDSSVRLARLLSWYWTAVRQPWDILNQTALMPAWVILPLAVAVSISAIILAAAVLRRA